MTSNSTEWTLVWPRKLTTQETAELQQRLRPLFSEGEEDDIQDIIDYAITVISNQKDIHYMVEEIAGMELEFCPSEVSNEMGRYVYDYLQELLLQQQSSGDTNNNEGDGSHQESTQGEKSHVVSLKSNRGNALTMSGALGASRDRNSKNATGALTSSREGGRKDANQGKKNRNEPEKRSAGRGGRRDEKGLAFDRLAAEKRNNNNTNNNAPQKRQSSSGEEQRAPRGRGEDRNDRERNHPNSSMNDRNSMDGGRRGGPLRDGRGGRGGGGRAERDHRDGGRSGGIERGRGGRGGERDMGDRGGRSIPGGRGGGREFRGGRGDDFEGRGRHSGSRRKQEDEGFEAQRLNKRVRRDEQDHNDGGYAEGYDESYEHTHHSGQKPAHWQNPAFRGRGRGRFGRGSPAGRGGFERPSYPEGSEVDPEAVAVNPSPMVADTFGRGFAGRGSFRGRGRGFYAPAYDHVKNMMKAKTWVRKKEGEDNEGGSGEQAEES